MAGCLGTLGLFGRDFDPDLVGPMVTLLPHTVVFGENQIADILIDNRSLSHPNSPVKITDIFLSDVIRQGRYI